MSLGLGRQANRPASHPRGARKPREFVYEGYGMLQH